MIEIASNIDLCGNSPVLKDSKLDVCCRIMHCLGMPQDNEGRADLDLASATNDDPRSLETSALALLGMFIL